MVFEILTSHFTNDEGILNSFVIGTTEIIIGLFLIFISINLFWKMYHKFKLPKRLLFTSLSVILGIIVGGVIILIIIIIYFAWMSKSNFSINKFILENLFIIIAAGIYLVKIYLNKILKIKLPQPKKIKKDKKLPKRKEVLGSVFRRIKRNHSK
jgi:amino acid permease